MNLVAEAGLSRQIRLPQAVALYVGSVLGSGVLLIPGYAADAGGVSAFVRRVYGANAGAYVQVALGLPHAAAMAIVVVLAAAVSVAAPHVDAVHFTPFAPRGVYGMGQAAALMFWCFIGWEAVTHLAEEFADPRRDTIRAILVAAVVVGVAYTAVGLVTVGTASYGPGLSSGALAAMVSRFLGPWAALYAPLVGAAAGTYVRRRARTVQP